MTPGSSWSWNHATCTATATAALQATRRRRPRGWLHLARSPSTLKTVAASGSPPAAAFSRRDTTTTTTAAVVDSPISSRPRRLRHATALLHASDNASSTSPPPPPLSSPLLTREAFSGEGGAEWAGWECRFSGTDGRPVAVPEDYVPESLREWDVEVWGFETLTSEQWRQGGGQDNDQDEHSNGSGVLYRKRGRVYPETGCALDNLVLEINVRESPLDGNGVFAASFPAARPNNLGGGYILGEKPEGSISLQLEVVLLVPGVQFVDPSMAAPTPGGDGAGYESQQKVGAAAREAQPNAGQEWSRARVEVRMESGVGDGGGDGGNDNGSRGHGPKGAAAVVLGPTVTVTRERKYRDAFDDGLLYKGGGLDSQKLRRLLRSKCFAESEASPTTEEFTGIWASGPGCWKLFHSPAVERKTSNSHRAHLDPADGTTHTYAPTDVVAVDREATYAGITTLLLRGGITVRSGPWHADDGSSSALERWGSAGAALTETLGEICNEAERWAVEVGWFVAAGSDSGERDGGERGLRERRREVLTTVIDARTMTPLGAWKGAERRGLSG